MPQISDFDLSLTDGLLLGLLVPIGVYLAYQVYLPGRGVAARLLLAMRCVVLILLILLMMEPILALTVRNHRKPLLALLIDDSESMRVEQAGSARKDEALEVLGSQIVREIESRARVSLYRFSEILLPMGRQGVDSLKWDGRATDIAGALDVLREVTSDEGLVATVVVTDGAHNLGGRPERAARDLGVPVFVVGVGKEEPPRDLAMVAAVIDPLGYVGRDIKIVVGIKSSGFEAAQDVIVVEESGQRVAIQPVRLTDGEQSAEFTIVPDRPGRHVFTVSVGPREGEQSSANNTMVLSTQILDSRLRVLLVAGAPSADLAYLRRLLEADENLALEMVVGTRPGQWPYRTQALINNPEENDLVILFDLPANIMDGVPVQRLADFVSSGGALMVVGGENSLDRGYASSPLGKLLPISLSGKGSSYQEEQFKVEIPRGGALHPILRITEDPLADRAEWAELPPLQAYNGNRGARPGATVLLYHSVERVGKQKMPLVVIGRAGKGKTMVVAARTFWRFGPMMRGIGKTEAASRAFWTNAAKWLVTEEGVDRVQVMVDKPAYRSGEAITFQARVLDELLNPLEGARVSISVLDSSGGRQVVLKDRGEGRYRGQMKAGSQGDYRFDVRAERGGQQLGKGSGEFTVGRYSLEYEDVRMNGELLRKIAAQSGGRFVRSESLPAVLDSFVFSPQPTTVHYRSRLWGKSWPLFLLVALLAAEWTIRRRRGMI
jgi:hypothetical protein